MHFVCLFVLPCNIFLLSILFLTIRNYLRHFMLNNNNNKDKIYENVQLFTQYICINIVPCVLH